MQTRLFLFHITHPSCFTCSQKLWCIYSWKGKNYVLLICMRSDFNTVPFTPSSLIPDGLDNRLFCGNVSVAPDSAVEDNEVFLFNLTTADPSRIAIAQSVYEVTITDSTGTAILHVYSLKICFGQSVK